MRRADRAVLWNRALADGKETLRRGSVSAARAGGDDEYPCGMPVPHRTEGCRSTRNRSEATLTPACVGSSPRAEFVQYPPPGADHPEYRRDRLPQHGGWGE